MAIQKVLYGGDESRVQRICSQPRWKFRQQRSIDLGIRVDQNLLRNVIAVC